MVIAVCNNCGGTEFYEESGHKFCSECQERCEIVQQATQEEDVEVNLNASKSRFRKEVKSTERNKRSNQITSWECYNYIQVGLTEELINLGASHSIKHVVKILWLRYLEKLQVFKRTKDELPKLQAVNCRKDGDIVYGRKRKRRAASSTKSSSDEDTLDATTMDSSSLKITAARQRRLIAQNQYNTQSTTHSQPDSSLHNETLKSVQTSSDNRSSNKTPVSFNTYASRELRKKQSRAHLRQHRHDFDYSLRCHTQMSYRKASYRYRVGPHVLSPNKLYALLYLACLINKERFQLGDLLRFIKEGHLSFNCYAHFFPDEFADSFVNYRDYKKNSAFCSNRFRKMALDVAKFLGVARYVTCPDLMEMCERYCTELNLPDEICSFAKKLISGTRIKMRIRKRQSKIPNYEGRVLSVILFVVKLLFGLDDATEFELSNYSAILNDCNQNPDGKMFDIIRWLKYIECRKNLMSSRHFPTYFFQNPGDDLKNIELFAEFLGKRELPETKFNKEKDQLFVLLQSLKGDRPLNPFSFDVSLCPFYHYTKQLIETDQLDGFMEDVLSQDFKDCQLTHVLRPVNFLKAFEREPEMIQGGANFNWIVEKIHCWEHERKTEIKRRRQLVTVELTLSREQSGPVAQATAPDSKDGAMLRRSFAMASKACFDNNTRRFKSRSIKVGASSSIPDYVIKSTKSYEKHYRPFEMYWLRLHMRLDAMFKKVCQEFVETMPRDFLLVFRECHRIAEQSEQEFLEELQLTELFLLFRAEYDCKSYVNRPVKDKVVQRFLDSCEDIW